MAVTTTTGADAYVDWSAAPHAPLPTDAPTGRSHRPGAPCGDCGRIHDRGNTVDRAARKSRLAARDGYVCTWCLSTLAPGRVDADRIVSGGRYTMANVVSACRGCNDSRRDGDWRDAVAMAADPARALAIVMRATGGRTPSAHLR